MYLGIDVGGTHTDAVVLSEGQEVLAHAKAVTRDPVIGGLREALQGLSKEVPLKAGAKGGGIRRLTVSTTLGLNSVLTGTAGPVGVLATSGPGLDIEGGPYGPLFRLIKGSQDHRGKALAPIDPAEAKEAAAGFAKKGAKAIVCASKFGPKNQELEEGMARAAREAFQGPVMLASSLFGGLNFKRRLNSAYLNALVHGIYRSFLADLANVLEEFGLTCETLLLKSDGGVMDLGEARRLPVLALAAGPAASLLGLWHLRGEAPFDTLMADMGGTSTDLAVISQGQPLLTPEGLRIAGLDTLVRGLLTRSMALGGDTDIAYEDRRFRPLPVRRGPALALEPASAPGRLPTLTDATNVLGLSSLGDTEVSAQAFRKLEPDKDPKELALLACEAVLGVLSGSASAFLSEINQRPAYTISELLLERRIEPRDVVFLGGPAGSIRALGEKSLGLPAEAPPEASYANALGAALAKPTIAAELYADTALSIMTIPVYGVRRAVGRDYRLDRAEADLLEAMGGGDDLQVTLRESFNQLGDYGRSGRVIRVRAQSAPGLISRA
ncbi:MAG: hypothetical protein LBF40_00595 [Deltaproteobacteria bacterium]|nr:hypothetical protein [Deltaproteobacteria bacterium]